MLLQNSRQLDTVMEMAALISSTLNARQVRERAIDAAVSLVGAEVGSLILIDQKTRELFFEVAAGKQGEILKLVRLKRGEGIAGWVYTSVPSTTTGNLGSISGSQYDAIDLQYVGNNNFMVLNYIGYLTVQ